MRELETLRSQLSSADEREREAKSQASREHSKIAGLQVGKKKRAPRRATEEPRVVAGIGSERRVGGLIAAYPF